MTTDPSVSTLDDVPDDVLAAQEADFLAQMAPVRPTVGPDAAPPYNEEAEASLLGAAMLSTDARDVLATLKPGDFYVPAHQHIAKALVDMHGDGIAVDIVTLSDWMGIRGTLDPIGGTRTLVELMGATPATSNARTYAEIIRRDAKQRRALALGAELVAEARDRNGDPAKVLARLAEFAEIEADDPGSDWAPVDLSGVLDGSIQPPEPTMLEVAGAPPLLYPAATNLIFGESGTGKTWVALAAVAERLHAGECVVYKDLEDTPAGLVHRLRLMGVPDDVLRTGLIYLRPEAAWGPVAQTAMARLIEARGVTLVVIDSVGEAMATAGVKGNDDDDVARWFTACPRYIARRGPAVVLIDHLPKDDSGSPLNPIGSQRKKAAIDGAMYRIDAKKAPSKSADGVLLATTAKDRHGTRHKGQKAAEVHLVHQGDGSLQVTVRTPTEAKDAEGNFRPTVLMERVSEYVEANPGQSTRRILADVKGNNKAIGEALGQLFVEGYVRQEQAGSTGWRYFHVRPFRQSDDAPVPSAATAVVVPPAPRDDPEPPPYDGPPVDDYGAPWEEF